jgi:hypothetical protein
MRRKNLKVGESLEAIAHTCDQQGRLSMLAAFVLLRIPQKEYAIG